MHTTHRILSAIAMTAALAATQAMAELKIVDGLTVGGFIDMSATTTETDAGSDSAMGFDQWELDFLFDLGDGITANVDINDVDGEDGVTVEQAYLVMPIGSGLSVKAGRMLTPLGYEAAEPTGLYQYSVSATIIGYPGYSNGVALMWANDLVSLYGSVVDGSYSGDEDANDVSVEGQIKLFPAEGLVLQAGYASEKFDATEESSSYDQGILNFWAEYKVGALTLAAEYNSLMEIGGPDGDGDGYLLMANYAFTDKCALTFRHSYVELDNGYENTEYTISPSYKITDNLLGLLEFRTDEYDDSSLDGESYAVELLYTF